MSVHISTSKEIKTVQVVELLLISKLESSPYQGGIILAQNSPMTKE